MQQSRFWAKISRSARRGTMGAVLIGAVVLEGAYGCVGEADIEDYIEENIGEIEQGLDDTPYAPSNLRLNGTLTSAVYLAWNDNSGDEAGFTIQRRRPGGTWAVITNPQYPVDMHTGQPLWPHEPNPTPSNGKQWVDRTPALGVTYEYRVVAYAYGINRYSNILTVATPQRRFVSQLTTSELDLLQTQTAAFLNDTMVDRHHNFRHPFSHPNETDGFLYDHRRYIQQLEEFMRSNGATSLVPLPMWNSATTIPTQLRPVEPRDNGTARTPISNASPNLARPSTFSPPSVCSYASVKALGSAVDPWHGNVHCTIDGTMCNIMEASAAYIFLPWHAYVDDAWVGWQRSCQTN